jgi:hypothetical protein
MKNSSNREQLGPLPDWGEPWENPPGHDARREGYLE